MKTKLQTIHFDSIAVMERYRISRRTLCRWLKDEQLGFPKPFRINRRYYFKATDLDRWDEKQGLNTVEPPETALGFPVVSQVIQSYGDFVEAMVRRRHALGMTCIELDARSGMQESYANKLENYGKPSGRGMGAEAFPLWLGGLRVGVVLVDLPRRPRRFRSQVAQDDSIDFNAAP